MRAMKMKKTILHTRLLLAPMVAVAFTAAAYAAAPGITGPTFNLTAQPAYLTQPDGAAIYSWGYGCNGAPSGFAPAAITGTFCNTMQVPGPTLIVTQGQTVTVNSDEWSAHRGRQHIDSVSRLSGDNVGRRHRPADAGGGARRYGDLYVRCLVRPGRAPITAEPKATCRWRWGCTEQSSCSRPASHGLHLRDWLRTNLTAAIAAWR